ncbi:VOC family protein [Shewanella sp. GXUN23E]|uniref:VOC family protein n=1 Tax=Shewanella sp. GXUN23E TaxID=3422498 RepID=UPI003D7E8529
MDIRALGYFVAQTDDLTQWQAYAEDVLGMMTSPAPGGGLYIKMDERPFRMLVIEGNDKRYLASGWELPSKAAFSAALQTLAAHDVPVELAGRELCAQRGAQQLAVFSDPAGNRHEIYWGYLSDCEPFVSPQGVKAFLTGEMGLGHTVLPAPNFDATYEFLTEVMGFGLSDIYHFRPGPDAPAVRIHFMHCANPRHHSLAICEFPVPSGCVHVMVEVPDMTEVGRAHDRRIAHQVPLSATLGQHLNDKMTSFYMKTPSGFDLEYGCGGLQMDWQQHSAFEFTKVSIWGHDFSVGQGGGQ